MFQIVPDNKLGHHIDGIFIGNIWDLTPNLIGFEFFCFFAPSDILLQNILQLCKQSFICIYLSQTQQDLLKFAPADKGADLTDLWILIPFEIRKSCDRVNKHYAGSRSQWNLNEKVNRNYKTRWNFSQVWSSANIVSIDLKMAWQFDDFLAKFCIQFHEEEKINWKRQR